MILVGIDVASNKHDIFIMNALGEVFNKHFTIDNTRQGYKKLLDQINQLLEHHITESKTTLLSIPGVGTQIGAINRFKSEDALLAFAGLDPSVYQSGNYEGSFKISKRGSSILRWAIFQAAKVAVIHDPVFNAYYEKKKSEGKHYLTIIGHVTKKLLRVIRSILKNNSVYTVSH
ncbi:IS110 family transposase [Acholeplasma equifetale]|uniref:IS110 family transposase n=1 Tax=Acholeplasma equifetale TaxID=264634 RepID=UPI00047E2B8E|nr:IS110 family transposase [Acholeplasma equifetale]